jgi:uncharacterized protein (DUF1778 family)
MVSINVDLSDDLRALAEQAARSQGVSLEDFVRNCVSARLDEAASDSLLSDNAVYDGPTPPDLSARHDDYLYGDQP